MAEGIPTAGVLAVVAHDLKNPLACIQSYVELMLERDMDAAQRAECLARVLASSRAACALVRDLCDADALERGQLSLRREWFSLLDLLKEAVASFEAVARARGAALTLRLATASTLVHADRGRVFQAVSNLIANALKHVPSGAGRVALVARQCGRELVIEVADNGIGIAPDKLPRLFGKFYRAEPERYEGLGLGLFIARKIAEASGGSLRAASEGLGLGASFSLSLPGCPSLQKTSAATQVLPVGGSVFPGVVLGGAVLILAAASWLWAF